MVSTFTIVFDSWRGIFSELWLPQINAVIVADQIGGIFQVLFLFFLFFFFCGDLWNSSWIFVELQLEHPTSKNSIIIFCSLSVSPLQCLLKISNYFRD